MSEPSAPRIRVAMVCAGAFPLLGGLESHVDEIAHRLNDEFDITILTVDRSGTLSAESHRHGVRILRFPAAPKNRDYLWSPALFRHIRESDYDFVHVQGINTFVPPTAMLAARRSAIPYLVTFHTGGANSRLRRVVRPLQFRALAPLLRDAAGHIAVSKFEANLFTNVMGERINRPVVIGNGSAALAAPQADSRSAAQLVLSIGRLEKYKGHQRAIAAMRRVVAVVPEAKLMILGAGPYEQRLRNHVKRFGLQDNVSIDCIPSEQRQRLVDVLHSASLTVLLSDFEAHPMAVVESKQAGTPVLVRKNSGMAELVDDLKVFGVRDRATTNEIGDAMITQLTQRRPVAADRAPWSWDDCARSTAAVYRAIMGSRLKSRSQLPAGHRAADE